MKKITITLLSLIASASFAQVTNYLDFDSVNPDFAFPIGNLGGFDADAANPDNSGINSTSESLEMTISTNTAGFGAVAGQKLFQGDVNGLFVQMLVRSNKNNINIRFAATDFEDPSATPPKEVEFQSLQGTAVYTGAGDWQFLEVELQFAAAFNNAGQEVTTATPPPNNELPRFAITPDADGTRDSESVVFVDEITQSQQSTNIVLSTGDFAKDEVSVYPIPATLAVNIRGNISGDSVDIYDVSGSLVGSAAITGDFNSVDVSALAKGVYFMRLENGSVLKFVK